MTENSPSIPVPADTNMHASLTLSKVNLYQHSEWNSVITKLIEMKITPEGALRILSRSLNHTNSEQATVQEQQNRDLSNQNDDLNKRKTIIAEFTVSVDLMDVPDEINLKPKIKFEVVNNYNSGKAVKLEYETILRSSMENMIQMCDYKQSTNKPENDKSMELPNLNDQDTILTQNPVFVNLKDHLYGQLIGTGKEYNILLLGEIGVGKSTFINAFANYMKYSDFETAKENNFIELIPSKFTLPDPETGASIMINSGMEDENEGFDIYGTSSTKAPKTYTFQLGNRTLRIIDTPGIGDTRGVDVDKTNFDQILAHLNNYNKLHSIVLLFRANETRKIPIFKYCITEILTHLHRNALKKLIFCFTFSRNSFYGPGDGFATLSSFLENELKDVPLTLKPGENCFFIDNEAYRFLVAQKQGYKFHEDFEDICKENWNKSVEQSNKMWGRIIKTAPHNLKSTISLNYVRKMFIDIAEPMVELHTMIQKIKTKKDSISVFDDEFKHMETTIEEYNYVYELTVINDISSKFAKLLITNSNITHNKFIGPYLDLLMDEEIKKIESVSSYSRSKYESLQKMKDAHQKNVQIIEDAIKSNKEKPVELKNIFRYKNLLFGLKHTGAELKEIIETGSFASKKSLKEKLIDLTNFTTGRISSTSVPTIPVISEFNSNYGSYVSKKIYKEGFWSTFWKF